MSSRTVVAAAAAFGLVGVALVVNPAEAARLNVSDGFDRVVASGWGIGPNGAQWAHPTGPFASRVGGSTAQIDLAAQRETRVRQTASDFAQPTLASTFVVPGWTNFIAGLESRITSTGAAYRSRAYVRKDGVVEVEVFTRSATGTFTRLCAAPTGVKVAPGALLRLESRTTGSSPVQLQVRAFTVGTIAPAWQLTCKDASATRLNAPGGVGVSLYTATAGTLKVADFSATDAAAAPAASPAAVATSTAPSSPKPTATATASRTATAAPTASATTAKPTASAKPTVSATASASATTAPRPVDTAAALAAPATGAGSLPIGQARYAVPADALHVATNGSDQAAGTAAAPLRTLAAAIAKALSGRTIVLHGGNYREAGLRVPEGKQLTIQNAPGEAVWLDGTAAVSGFVQTGSTWTKSGWTAQFDASPTFTRGAADSTTKFWQFVNPAQPMAAHPDQVWVNGTRLTQVATASAVVPGTFYVDDAADKLVLGTNPNGANVTASVLGDALTILGAGTTLRGIGLNGYATSVPDMGAITVYATGVTLENVEVRDAATGGIGLYRANPTLRQVTVTRAGQLAVMGNLADNTMLDRVKVVDANAEQFNPTPAAGGVKFTTSRGITMRNSIVSGSRGNAFWVDESSYDIALVSSEITNNSGRGVFVELSEKAVIVNNRITGNGDDQIRIANSARVDVWNNSISGSTQPIMVGQDDRAPGTSGYAVDSRRPNPDPDMTWIIKNTTIGNNVFESSGSVAALVRVEDWSRRFTGDQMVTLLDSNAYTRTSSSPKWVLAWSGGAGNPKVFTTVAQVAPAIGRESKGQEFSGASQLAANGAVRSDAGVNHAKASALPTSVASRSGFTATPGRVGIVR